MTVNFFLNIHIRSKIKKKLKSILKKNLCYAVIHCVGVKAVSDSVKKPIDYFSNNIKPTLSLLECIKEKNIFKLIFSSSATIYNDK